MIAPDDGDREPGPVEIYRPAVLVLVALTGVFAFLSSTSFQTDDAGFGVAFAVLTLFFASWWWLAAYRIHRSRVGR